MKKQWGVMTSLVTVMSQILALGNGYFLQIGKSNYPNPEHRTGKRAYESIVVSCAGTAKKDMQLSS